MRCPAAILNCMHSFLVLLTDLPPFCWIEYMALKKVWEKILPDKLEGLKFLKGFDWLGIHVCY